METHSKNILSKSLGTLFKRFHMIIFFVFMIAILSVVVILINQILTANPSDTTYTSSIQAGSIDETTLNRVQSLHTSDSTATPALSSTRINPFGE